MRVVLDTNILVSALLTPSGNSARILALVIGGELIVQYDQRILAEYRNVLARDKFAFPRDAVETLLSFIEQEGEARTGIFSADIFVDESDRKFWELARTAPTEALVTGNAAHFPEHANVMNPREFLEYFARRG